MFVVMGLPMGILFGALSSNRCDGGEGNGGDLGGEWGSRKEGDGLDPGY